MNLSHLGEDHLISLEGMILEEYKDSAGYPTIGVGHLLTPSELASKKIKIGDELVDYTNGLTKLQVWQLLAKDVSWAVKAVNDDVHVPLNQNQFDSLVSFVFNTGAEGFRKGSLLVELNKSNYDAIPGKMRKWIFSGGKIDPILVNRRETEIKLWLSPVLSPVNLT